MTQKPTLFLVALLAILAPEAAVALEVDREVLPRITVGGRSVATLDAVDHDSSGADETEINVEDSAILMRFDKRLYENGVAGAVFGFKESEDQVEFHQFHAFYWDRDKAAAIGRMQLRNLLIEFPILRDEDLLEYTHVGNASSNIEFDQRYGELVSFDWFIDRRIQRLGVWGATRRNGPSVAGPDGIDTWGMGYVYEQPEDLQYVKWIRHAGIMLDRQKVTTGAGDEWMSAVIAGIEFNLNMNPQSNWSAAVQIIRNQGIDGITAADVAHGNANAVSNRARAAYTSVVASLRHTARPHLLTRYQGAVTVAWKEYSDIPDATQWSVAPGFVYRLGQGVDLLGQVRYTDYDAGLGGGSDTTVQLGIAFSLEARFNDNIGERDSILNLEHGYIK